jgi:hypothetical protein
MVAILHFNLVHPIMLGNKKAKDVQFYTEVGDVVQTLDGKGRSMVSREFFFFFFFFFGGRARLFSEESVFSFDRIRRLFCLPCFPSRDFEGVFLARV